MSLSYELCGCIYHFKCQDVLLKWKRSITHKILQSCDFLTKNKETKRDLYFTFTGYKNSMEFVSCLQRAFFIVFFLLTHAPFFL